MKLVILAGGKGTRLGLKHIPKPMARINGFPILEWQIRLAYRFGIKDIIILSGHLAEVIFNYFGDGSKWGLRISHVIEPFPLGTAGALKMLEHLIDNTFFVFYGDTFLDIDLNRMLEFHTVHSKPLATILIHPNDHPCDSDLVEVENGSNEVINFLPKPHALGSFHQNLVNAALYIFEPSIFQHISFNIQADLGKHTLPAIIAAKIPIFAYKTTEYIKDIGTKERLASVSFDIISGKVAARNSGNAPRAIFLDFDSLFINNLSSDNSMLNSHFFDLFAEAVKTINNSNFLLFLTIFESSNIKKVFLFKSKIIKKVDFELGIRNAFFDDIFDFSKNKNISKKNNISHEKRTRKNHNCNAIRMFLEISKQFNINLHNSWIITNSLNILYLGKSTACLTASAGNIKFDNCNITSTCVIDAIQRIISFR